MGKFAIVSIAVALCAGSAYAQSGGDQTAPMSDYQRVMNSANNSSSAAFGQPQSDEDANNNTAAGTTGNPNTAQAAPPDAAGSANLPTGGIASTYSANGSFGNPVAGNAGQVTGNTGYGYGSANTTSGGIGLGSYNASPYNSQVNTNQAASSYNNGARPGRSVTSPNFTGQ